VLWLNQDALVMSTTAAQQDLTAFALDAAEDDYTVWLRAKVQRALEDPRPRIPHDEAMARIRRSIEEVAQQKTQGRN